MTATRTFPDFLDTERARPAPAANHDAATPWPGAAAELFGGPADGIVAWPAAAPFPGARDARTPARLVPARTLVATVIAEQQPQNVSHPALASFAIHTRYSAMTGWC